MKNKRKTFGYKPRTNNSKVLNDEMPEVADDDMEDEFETDSEEDDDD